MVLTAAERWLLLRFLLYLLRDKRPIDLGNQLVRREARFQAESRQDRKKRLRKLREQRKDGRLSADDRRILDGLEGSAVYSSGYASVFQPKTPGRRAANSPETKRLYVAIPILKALYPERDAIEFLEDETEYREANPRSLETLLWRFGREHVPTEEALFQLVERQFRMFKDSEIARLHPELYQGFPPGRIPPSSPITLSVHFNSRHPLTKAASAPSWKLPFWEVDANGEGGHHGVIEGSAFLPIRRLGLANTMESEMQLLQSICKLRFNSQRRKPLAR